MAVRVVPGGLLKQRFPQDAIIVEDGGGKTVEEILQALEIPSGLVPAVMVNGQPAQKDAVLRDGDVVRLLSFLGGG